MKRAMITCVVTAMTVLTYVLPALATGGGGGSGGGW